MREMREMREVREMRERDNRKKGIKEDRSLIPDQPLNHTD